MKHFSRSPGLYDIICHFVFHQNFYRITSTKRRGRLLNFSIFRGVRLFVEGGVCKILAIFFSHKIKEAYKILKSLQYF